MYKRQLHLEVGTSVWRLSRIRLANNQPVALATAYILRELAPSLKAGDLEMSLMDMMEKCYQISFVHSETYCMAALADAHLAEMLDCAEGAPILQTEYVGYSPAHYPAMVDITQSLGDKYILRIDQGDTAPSPAEQDGV